MSSLERTLGALLVLAGLLVVGWLGVLHYGAARYDAGYAAAVAEGIKARDAQAAIHRQTETDLRAQIRARDDKAFLKEVEHAATLEAAKRRHLTGADRLRCPAGPVSAGAAPIDRPATSGPAPDVDGPSLVPEAAADVLGIAADVAGLVRRYERLEERFDQCHALNAK